jgi:hypothetical protein
MELALVQDREEGKEGNKPVLEEEINYTIPSIFMVEEYE